MTSLRVLITNNTLGSRAGTELYVRDLAIALIDRGHRPIAYSTILGEVAEELRAATVPVIDNLTALTTAPDIIHGHHHLETMTALLSFPDVPAIYFCHGWLPWEEAPPRFPRILRYLAVDTTCRDRLVCEHGIGEDRIDVLLNFVDTRRFKPRAALPESPKRALIFNNATDQTYVRTVREACERAGITLDIIGLSAGNPIRNPELALPDYDIVFAKGRSALEALAVGTAVVLCDWAGSGPMVTVTELDRLRSLNFGIRALRFPLDTETIAREIARYDAKDATAVSSRIRASAHIDTVIDKLVSLYQEVIGEFKKESRPDLHQEQRAAAGYLRELSPRLKEVNELRAQLADRNEAICKLTEMDKRERELQNRFAAQSAAMDVLKGRDAELNRIKRTMGWRLLSLYGPIKYQLVMPVWNYLRGLFR